MYLQNRKDYYVSSVIVPGRIVIKFWFKSFLLPKPFKNDDYPGMHQKGLGAQQ